MSTIHEGGCLCAAIRYRATGAAVARTLCHCRSCRLASGAPSLAWTVFDAGDFRFVSGTPRYFRSSPDAMRGFCAECGTSLTYQRESRAQMIDVTTATLDFPDRYAPTCEIWTSHRLPWQTSNAALPQHPRSSRESKAD